MEAVFDFKEFISGDKSIDDVTEHLLGITTSDEMKEEIFSLIKVVHDDTLGQGYKRGMADVIGCEPDEVLYWTDSEGSYDGVYKGPRRDSE
jgi:hypothetical protein